MERYIVRCRAPTQLPIKLGQVKLYEQTQAATILPPIAIHWDLNRPAEPYRTYESKDRLYREHGLEAQERQDWRYGNRDQIRPSHDEPGGHCRRERPVQIVLGIAQKRREHDAVLQGREKSGRENDQGVDDRRVDVLPQTRLPRLHG